MHGGGHFEDSGDTQHKPLQARPKRRSGYSAKVRKRKMRGHGKAHMMRAGKVDRVKAY